MKYYEQVVENFELAIQSKDAEKIKETKAKLLSLIKNALRLYDAGYEAGEEKAKFVEEEEMGT